MTLVHGKHGVMFRSTKLSCYAAGAARFVGRSEKPNPVVRSAAGLGYSRGSKHERIICKNRHFLVRGPSRRTQFAMRHWSMRIAIDSCPKMSRRHAQATSHADTVGRFFYPESIACATYAA